MGHREGFSADPQSELSVSYCPVSLQSMCVLPYTISEETTSTMTPEPSEVRSQGGWRQGGGAATCGHLVWGEPNSFSLIGRAICHSWDGLLGEFIHSNVVGRCIQHLVAWKDGWGGRRSHQLSITHYYSWWGFTCILMVENLTTVKEAGYRWCSPFSKPTICMNDVKPLQKQW